LTSRIELKLPSQMAFLGVPDAVLLEIGSDLACPRQLIEELGTAVIEACSNAIEHGNGHDPVRIVELHIDVAQDRLEVAVLDSGPGFDYQNWQPAEDLMRERGRGIMIMRGFTDELHYDRSHDDRFRVRLVKYLARES
jgi:serine/threonine-protein kinase RsbW